MCGIVGFVGSGDVVPFLVEGLRRLEYRGYDSAGVAVVDRGEVRRVRSAGKLGRLEDALKATPVSGTCGIGHTRWATHGRPTDENAHPHASCRGDIALVHNGIIENFQELRQRLRGEGHQLRTETDTEVLAHLVEDELESCGRGGRAKTLLDAVRGALGVVRGVHALAVVSAAEPDCIVVTSNGPPALVGIGDGINAVASDLAPLLSHVSQVMVLEEGDIAQIRRESVQVFDAKGAPAQRTLKAVDMSPVEAEKGGYPHFMLKEIHEQPRTIEDCLIGHVAPGSSEIVLPEAELDDRYLRELDRVVLIGCGTAYHAAMVGRRLIELFAGVPCEVDVASEFRYRQPLLPGRTLAVAVTQSGETADTIAAMREAKERGARLLTACNVLGSLATRVADGVIHTRAGLEIGVASTKAFTAQLVALTLLALRIGQARGLHRDVSDRVLAGLRAMPRLMERQLARESRVIEVAQATAGADHYLFLGRGILHPLALEGALKLKEISYVHAEGYPAGEMKHGPIALVDAAMPVLALCLRTPTHEKMLANAQEVKARDGILVAVVTEGDASVASFADHVIEVPDVEEALAPLVAAVPLQLLAYHVGLIRGCDVDQPRNLAKSVTVE